MQEDPNPVKEYIFEYVENSQTIPKLIAEKRFDKIIIEVIENCYDGAISMADKDEAVGILATGLLHYLLTNALINSQRKIEYRGEEIDVVVPDLRTLEKDPQKTLLLCIPKSSDKKIIDEKISKLERVQPEKKNIWVILSENITINKKSFILSKEDDSFSKIIFDIAQFSNVGGTNKFKILRV